MMDWEEIIALVGLILIVVWLSFVNIRWTIRFWRNKLPDKTIKTIPIEKINNQKNDCSYDRPKPDGVRLDEFTELNHCPDKKRYTENNECPFKSPSQIFITSIAHTKQIIERLSTKCKQNHWQKYLTKRKYRHRIPIAV